MADEKFDLMKFISGPTSAVYWAKVISFMFGMGFLIFIGVGVWRGYFKKPEPTTIQNNQADAIVYHYPTPKATFGCASVRVQEYYAKEKTLPKVSTQDGVPKKSK